MPPGQQKSHFPAAKRSPTIHRFTRKGSSLIYIATTPLGRREAKNAGHLRLSIILHVFQTKSVT